MAKNWLSETFSSDAKEDDIIKSRSLNITRIAGVVVPVVTAIATAIAEFAKVAPWNDARFQQRLFLALLAFVGAVTVADIFGRAIAAAAASRAEAASRVPSATLLPMDVPVVKVGHDPDVSGRVVAFSTPDGASDSAAAEYLFVSDDGETVAWMKASALRAKHR